jgi:hypothetical protein
MAKPDGAVTYFPVLHNSHPGKPHASDDLRDCWLEFDNQRIVGVFTTREKAEQAVEAVRQLPGFSAEPHCFTVDEWSVGEEMDEGFVVEFWT